MVMPAFRRFPDEAAIIGRLLADMRICRAGNRSATLCVGCVTRFWGTGRATES